MALIEAHRADPGRRELQRRLAEEATLLVHGQEALETALAASNILFGKSTAEQLKSLSESDFLDIFDGVDQSEMANIEGVNIVDLLTDSGFLASKSEAKRELKGNAISVNKTKVGEEYVASSADLIQGKYLLLQKGKKTYYILNVTS